MRVLFIGNSHTYFNDMPETFSKLWADAYGQKPDVTMLAYSSRSLAWHENEYFALRFNLLYGNYDFCVIQQQAHPFPGREETETALKPILEFCRKAGTVPLLVETWAEKIFPENQQKMLDCYEALSSEYTIQLVPVGRIWQELLQSHPEIDLFWKDGEHASPIGDYLIALCLCRVISGNREAQYSASAHDFIRDGDIDFGRPYVIEDTALTEIELPKEIVNILQEAVMRR